MIKPQVLGAIAIVGAVLGILYAPFHAAAYLNTPDGSVDPPILAWDEGFRDAVPGAFDFASPQDVYVTYGRLLPIVLLGVLAAWWLLHQRQQDVEGRVGRGFFWAMFGFHALLTAAVVVEYYTPYLDEAFMVAFPSLLLGHIACIGYGIVTIRRRALPRDVGVLLLVGAALLIPLIALFGHLPLALTGLFVAAIRIGTLCLKTPDAAPGSASRSPPTGLA